MNSIRPLLRYGAATLCFGAVVWLFATMPFGERGYHFLPAASADERLADEDYDLSKLRILTRCVGYVRSYYVDPGRIDPREMLVSALESVQRILPPLLVEVEREGPLPAHPDGVGLAAAGGGPLADAAAADGEAPIGRPRLVRLTLYGNTSEFPLDRLTDLYEMNWKMLDIFQFIEQGLRRKDRLPDIEYAAVNGMLQTLDPHSVMLDPDTYREMRLGTSGEFGGLGIVISVRDGHLTIVNVIEDTPAAEAGLKTGDRIVQVGEESTVNMTLNDAVNRLRGEPGSRVTVWVARDGWTEPRAYALQRENITIKSAVGRPLGRGVGYVRIKHFQQNTWEELESELGKLRTSGHWRGLILDLRDNPGGLLDQAILVSDTFLDAGTIVTTVGAGSRLREEKKAAAENTIADVPLVVLVNGGSASASEIVAGALKNNDRALVIGDRTFGKGSVQVLYDIEDAALKLTIAQYLTPGDQSIQSVGIVPDIRTLPVRISQSDVDLFVTDRDLHGERDLPKHLSHRSARQDVLPDILLKFLDEEPAAAGAGANGSKAAAEDEQFQKDKTIRFAEALLTRAPSPDRAAMLGVARELFADLAADEDRAIREKLAALGVDWRPSPRPDGLTAEPPRLHVTAVASPEGPVRAGDEVTLRVTVRNDGNEPLYRLHGISRSTYRRFDDQEFVFGRVAPGETREWALPLKVPRSVETRYDDVWVDLFSDGRPLGVHAATPVEVRALPRPRFAYSVQVRDDRQGNGDGLVQRGERFALRLRVRNVGEGTTFKAIATVKNLNGESLYTHEGRRRFEELAPGEEVTLDFDLEVKPNHEEDRVRLELTIVDTTLRDQLEREIELPVGPPATGGSRPVTLRARVRAGGTNVFAGAAESTGTLGDLEGGDVVAADAAANGFLRVALRDGEVGWVTEAALEPLAGAAPVSVHYEPTTWGVPPQIDLDAAAVPLHTADEVLPLSFGVSFPEGDPGAPRVVYVYRGDEKLDFEEYEAMDGAPLAVSLTTRVELEPGVNTIVVFAKVGEAAPTIRTIHVQRDGKEPEPLEEVR